MTELALYITALVFLVQAIKFVSIALFLSLGVMIAVNMGAASS